MALKATVFRVELQVTDLDRHYYATHTLTLARHPSETDERMMVRLLAFALHADETLRFTRGLSSEDEPALWRKSLSDDITLWIELGQPDEKRLRRACGRADTVYVYSYGGHSAALWWDRVSTPLQRLRNLHVVQIDPVQSRALTQLVQRTMQLQCTLQDGQIWLGDATRLLEISPTIWKDAQNSP